MFSTVDDLVDVLVHRELTNGKVVDDGVDMIVNKTYLDCGEFYGDVLVKLGTSPHTVTSYEIIRDGYWKSEVPVNGHHGTLVVCNNMDEAKRWQKFIARHCADVKLVTKKYVPSKAAFTVCTRNMLGHVNGCKFVRMVAPLNVHVRTDVDACYYYVPYSEPLITYNLKTHLDYRALRSAMARDGRLQVHLRMLALTASNDIECPVCCEENSVAPVHLLRCSHSVCANCVKGARRADAPFSKCPMCRSEFYIRSTVNLAAENLVKTVREAVGDEKTTVISSTPLKFNKKTISVITDEVKFKDCSDILVIAADGMDGHVTGLVCDYLQNMHVTCRSLTIMVACARESQMEAATGFLQEFYGTQLTPTEKPEPLAAA